MQNIFYIVNWIVENKKSECSVSSPGFYIEITVFFEYFYLYPLKTNFNSGVFKI